MKRKTKVEKHGAFWQVLVLIGGEWHKMRALYLTREKARQDCYYWANY